MWARGWFYLNLFKQCCVSCNRQRTRRRFTPRERATLTSDRLLIKGLVFLPIYIVKNNDILERKVHLRDIFYFKNSARARALYFIIFRKIGWFTRSYQFNLKSIFHYDTCITFIAINVMKTIIPFLDHYSLHLTNCPFIILSVYSDRIL